MAKEKKAQKKNNKSNDQEVEKLDDQEDTGSKKVLNVGKTAEVYTDKPVKRISNNFVQCFEGKDKRDGSLLVAYLCDKIYMPRLSKIPAYKTISNPNLISLVRNGVVKWPHDRKEYYMLIYKDDLGQAIAENDESCALGLKPEIVQTKIVKPIVEVLKDLRNNDIVHGNIRPSNLFKGGDRDISSIVLGDCLSIPNGLNQAKIFEPIDRALAQPSGRGEGLFEDDIYSLGVTLSFLVRTRNHLRNMNDDEIIQRKMEQGSYVTLIGQERITGPMLELLRGTLNDDPKSRWNIDNLIAWTDGQRLSPKNTDKQRKASRQIIFDSKKYFYPAALGMDVANKPNMIDEIISNGELKQWVERAFTEKAYAESVEGAINSVKKTSSTKSSNYVSRLSCRLAVALHPEGPIRYKGLSILPQGFGTALAETMVLGQDASFFKELLVNDEYLFWAQNNQNAMWDTSSLVPEFETVRTHVKASVRGYGLEYCLYYLNPDMPCVSPLFKEFFLTSPEDYIRALERVSKRKTKPDQMMDAHVIAFMMIKEENLISNNLIDLNAPAQWKRLLTTLKILSTIQKQSNMEEMPGLTSWFAELMRPIYERYHDREYRKDLQEKVLAEKKSGDLSKLLEIVDNPTVIQKDTAQFRIAMREYKVLETLKNQIEAELDKPEDVGIRRGLEVAVIVCFILAIILVLVFSAATVGSYQDLGF